MRLGGKVAIVTGGASGMGAATVRLFAREGAAVVVADRLEAEGAAVAHEVGAAGGTARFEFLDVTDEGRWRTVVQATVERFGKLDILINNAGISGSDPDLLSTALWDELMTVNAKGAFLGMKAAIPAMQRQRAGAIVNISSISGFVGQSMVHMGYNAAKAALRLMTKAVAVQHAKDGIRANSVHPGIMPPMRSSKLTADPAIRAELIAQIPMGREGRVEEVAQASLFLASDDASYITGTELVVDGGFLAV